MKFDGILGVRPAHCFPPDAASQDFAIVPIEKALRTKPAWRSGEQGRPLGCRGIPFRGPPEHRRPNGFRMDFEWISNGFRTGFERVSNGFRTDFERISNGFRTGFERVSNGF